MPAARDPCRLQQLRYLIYAFDLSTKRVAQLLVFPKPFIEWNRFRNFGHGLLKVASPYTTVVCTSLTQALTRCLKDRDGNWIIEK